jgi:hypothetical protein
MPGELDRGKGVVQSVTKVSEAIGLLNKGSAAISASAATDGASELPVSSNSLNVTRVGGTGAVIAAAGAAALALFRVHTGDPNSIIVAAYASTGLIVAAALVTTAIIISADIKARSSASGGAGTSKADTKSFKEASKADTESFKEAWTDALDRLQDVKVALPAADRNAASALWLNAKATGGFTGSLTPPTGLADEHARLLAAQTRASALLEELISYHADGARVDEVKKLIDEAEITLNHIP